MRRVMKDLFSRVCAYRSLRCLRFLRCLHGLRCLRCLSSAGPNKDRVGQPTSLHRHGHCSLEVSREVHLMSPVW